MNQDPKRTRAPSRSRPCHGCVKGLPQESLTGCAAPWRLCPEQRRAAENTAPKVRDHRAALGQRKHGQAAPSSPSHPKKCRKSPYARVGLTILSHARPKPEDNPRLPGKPEALPGVGSSDLVRQSNVHRLKKL